MSLPIVLTFAASDPTGGAGLQADILSIAAMGCHPLSVVTALTVQDTSGVSRVQPVAHGWVADQARTLLADMRVGAIKLGVLGSAQNVREVAKILAEHPGTPVVLDPVLASGRGDTLACEDTLAALLRDIVPLATVVTPNSIEARRLGGVTRLLEGGARFVLVTGTHEDSEEVINVLHDAGGIVREDRWPRLPGSYHGSGCTLASALASALALGSRVGDAARRAQEFTWQSLEAGFAPGRGQSLPMRLFRDRETR
jgi:hydroxymethylpyrimidine/phosphomethylpyrimidine kinase